jgi:hypothetical protein
MPEPTPIDLGQVAVEIVMSADTETPKEEEEDACR